MLARFSAAHLSDPAKIGILLRCSYPSGAPSVCFGELRLAARFCGGTTDGQTCLPDGKTLITRNVYYYVWRRGSWHAFFSQQTPVEVSQG